MAAEEGVGPCWVTHTQRWGELLIAMQHLNRGDLWDSGGSKHGECDCNSINVRNDGSFPLDQEQIGGRYVIN